MRSFMGRIISYYLIRLSAGFEEEFHNKLRDYASFCKEICSAINIIANRKLIFLWRHS